MSDNEEAGSSGQSTDALSRRTLIRKSAEVIGSGAAALATSGLLSAQQSTAPVRSAAQTIAGRKFRAFIRTTQGASVQEVKMLPLRDDMIAIRTEATQCCYTIVNQALGSGNNGAGKHRIERPDHWVLC